MSMTIPTAPLPAPTAARNRPDSTKRENRQASTQEPSTDPITETTNDASCVDETQSSNAAQESAGPATFADILATIVFGGVLPTATVTAALPTTPVIATSATDLLASLQVQVALATDAAALAGAAITAVPATTIAPGPTSLTGTKTNTTNGDETADSLAALIATGEEPKTNTANLAATTPAPSSTPQPTMAVNDVVSVLVREIAALSKSQESPIVVAPEVFTKLRAADPKSIDNVDVDPDITTAMAIAPAVAAKPLDAKLVSVEVSADTQAVFDQISQQISTVKHKPDGTYRIAIQLHPEDLGQLSVQVEVKNGIVDIRFRADNSNTRDLLRSSEHALRIHLEESGVSAGNVDVGDMARNFNQSNGNSATRGTNTKDFDVFADEFMEVEPAAQGRVAAAIMTDRELDVQM